MSANKEELLLTAQEREKEEGATMIEYALLIVLIAIIAIAAIRLLGQKVSQQFSYVADTIGN